MGSPLTDLSFDAWVEHVFDHAVGGPQWYWGPEADFWNGPPAVTVEYLTRLFRDADTILEWYADAQIDQGFWYMFSGCTLFNDLLDGHVAEDARLACVESIFALYEKLFAPRCAAELGHSMRSGDRPHPLNTTCYMFWDLFPTWGSPDEAGMRAFDAACLDVMKRTLALDSVACRESALHGLGHWCGQYPVDVESIVGEFLEQCPDLDPVLRDYALAARSGCVN